MEPSTKTAPDAAALSGFVGEVRALVPPAGGTLWVAYSGGRDSAVLVHLAAAAREALSPTVVRAVYVDHGLQAAAPAWAAHCERVCVRLGIPLEVLRVDARPRAGEGPQAAARHARYTALRGRMRAGDVLVVAHHRGDQAETVLLRALRGSGLEGLGAMAPVRRFGPGWLLRPLLRWPRSRVAAYAAAAGLEWVDDPANATERYARPYLRRRLWPAIEARWPGAEVALARLADHARAAAEASTQAFDSVLPVAALRPLDATARARLLRAFLAARGVLPPSSARLAAGIHALVEAGMDRQPCMRWGAHQLRRYRGAIHLLRSPLPVPPRTALAWCSEAELRVEGLGVLRAETVRGSGFATARLPVTTQLEVRFRAGGERVRTAAGHRPLKKLFQEAGVPPWQRDRLPLLYVEGVCIGVPGLVYALPWHAQPGESGWRPVWTAVDASV